MTTISMHYCVICGDDREFRHEQRPTEFEVRGETLVFEVPVKVCPTCGTVEEEEGVDPAETAFGEFRKRKGLLTPEEIKSIRKRFRLSQKSLAALLGMSEASVNRYEGGGLQDEAHDQAIRALQNPAVVRDLLERRGDRLSAWQRRRVLEALESEEERPKPAITLSGECYAMPKEVSPTTGYREFDYLRYVAVVLWLCRHLPVVTATSLNKLLFYVDFLHFKSEAVSLTGAAYRRVQHGPVPAAYGDLQQSMELEGFIEVQEVQYQNGRTGMEFRPGPKAEDLKTTFAPRELRILESVGRAFKDVTPRDIRDRSHQESAWKDTEDRALISYEKAADLSLSVPD